MFLHEQNVEDLIIHKWHHLSNSRVRGVDTHFCTSEKAPKPIKIRSHKFWLKLAQAIDNLLTHVTCVFKSRVVVLVVWHQKNSEKTGKGKSRNIVYFISPWYFIVMVELGYVSRYLKKHFLSLLHAVSSWFNAGCSNLQTAPRQTVQPIKTHALTHEIWENAVNYCSYITTDI